MWDYYLRVLAKVDKKGRVVIPPEIRKSLGIKGFVKIEAEEDRVILKPVEDLLDSLKRLVTKGTMDVEKEIREFRLSAEHQLLEEAGRS